MGHYDEQREAEYNSRRIEPTTVNLPEAKEPTYEYFIRYKWFDGRHFDCESQTLVGKWVTEFEVWEATCGSEVLHLLYNKIPDDCTDYEVLQLNKL